MSELPPETRRALIVWAPYAEIYECKIRWALRALEKGADSEGLRVLAGLALEKHPNPREVDELFDRSLKDLGLPYPDLDELLRQRARDICEGILSGDLSVEQATRDLYLIALELGYPDDLSVWVALDDDLHILRMTGDVQPSREALVEDIRRAARAFVEATPKTFF